MVNIQKIRKNDISFGNTEENKKGGNTNTALGVGLAAGVLGYLGGRKFLTTDPNAEQVLAKPDEFIPSNLSAEEQKAADTIKAAFKEMSELDKKVEEEVSQKFKKKNEITVRNAEKKIEKNQKYIDGYKKELEKLNKKLEKQNKKLAEKNKWVEEAPNGFNKFLRKLVSGRGIKGLTGLEGRISDSESRINSKTSCLDFQENQLGFYKAAKDGKVTRESYKTYLSDAIKNRIINRAEEALKTLKGKLTKAGSSKKAFIAAAVFAVVGFFAAKALTKPKEAPIPEETEEIEVAEKSKKFETPEEVEVVEVSEETQETDESEEKAA